jgi:hypothetical protein
MAILEQATQKYGNEVANTTALAKAQYRAAYEDLQATWGQFVNTVLMPVLNVLTQIMTFITMGMQALAKLTGKTIETSKTQASNAQNTANSIGTAVENQDDLTKSVKETAKAQKGMLAGFDKINKLTEETASANDTPSSTPSGTGGGFTLPSIGDGLGQQESAISSTLATIMGIAGGALVAIGLILIATGNIAWGVGFIIAGALTLGVSMAMIKDTQISETVRNSVTKGIVIAGMFALVVGLLLCAVPGKIGYGLALVALGVVSLVGAAALNWEGIKEMLQGPLGTAIAIVGIVAVVIGIILCMIPGKLPFGLALIAVGGVALATPIAANWNVFLEKLKEIWGGIKKYWDEKIAPWFTKEKWSELLGKIKDSFLASDFVQKITEIWDAVKLFWQTNIAPWFTKEKWVSLVNKIKERFEASKWGKLIKNIWEGIKTFWNEKIAPWFTKDKWVTLVNKIKDRFEASKFSKLIKGIWEAVKKYYDEHIKPWFTKDKWVSLVNKIKNRFASSKWVKLIKNIWEGIKTFWNEKIAPWFTITKWQELAGKCGDGLKNGFKNAINSIISYFETLINRVIDKFNTISFTVPDWVPVIHGNKYGVDISKVSIPRLAEGAVIPPNREFLAVLGDQKRGTNIEAPATLIKQMVKEGLNEIGYMGGNETITIPLYLDGDVLFQAVVKRNQNYKKALGVSPLGI